MANVQPYWDRVLNTLWQSALASLSVAQVSAAITGGLSAGKQVALTAIGAGVAAVISFVKNNLWKPAATGTLGIIERGLATFVQGAAGAVSVTQFATAWGKLDVGGLESVGLSAMGGGVAAILSLMQHTSQAASAVAPPQPANPFDFNDPKIPPASDLGGFVADATAVGGDEWSQHMRNGDVSKWLATSVGNASLAAKVRKIEIKGGATSRPDVIAAIQAAYPILGS